MKWKPRRLREQYKLVRFFSFAYSMQTYLTTLGVIESINSFVHLIFCWPHFRVVLTNGRNGWAHNN